MSDIQIFNNPDFGEIRTVIINGEPWFVSKDISEKLGYVKPANMVKLVDEDDKRNLRGSDLEPGSKAQISAVNESGLYAAIFGSKQENAKKFKKWVTSEVLPSIRKTGEYKQENAGDVQGQIKLLAQGTTELYEKVDTLEQRFNKFEDELPVTGEDIDHIQMAVRKKGIQSLGGKHSNAYKDISTRTFVYADIQCELRRQFGVKKYKEIKHKDTTDALRIVNSYQLPIALKNRVDMVNAQQSLDLEGGAR